MWRPNAAGDWIDQDLQHPALIDEYRRRSALFELGPNPAQRRVARYTPQEDHSRSQASTAPATSSLSTDGTGSAETKRPSLNRTLNMSTLAVSARRRADSASAALPNQRRPMMTTVSVAGALPARSAMLTP